MKEKTIERIRKFTEDRDWDQFHSPANLAKSIVIEAAELLECFQWSDTKYDLQHIKEELADVLVYSQNLLDKLELDADEIVNMKMKQNEAKYPVDKAKGNATKYTDAHYPVHRNTSHVQNVFLPGTALAKKHPLCPEFHFHCLKSLQYV